MQKTKTFCESVLNQLKKSEETLSRTKKIGLFVCQFVTEVKTITESIITTDIPQENIPALILGLETFYKEFEAQYPREEDGCGNKKERALIEESFAKAIDNLKGRL